MQIHWRELQDQKLVEEICAGAFVGAFWTLIWRNGDGDGLVGGDDC